MFIHFLYIRLISLSKVYKIFWNTALVFCLSLSLSYKKIFLKNNRRQAIGLAGNWSAVNRWPVTHPGWMRMPLWNSHIFIAVYFCSTAWSWKVTPSNWNYDRCPSVERVSDTAYNTIINSQFYFSDSKRQRSRLLASVNTPPKM